MIRMPKSNSFGRAYLWLLAKMNRAILLILASTFAPFLCHGQVNDAEVSLDSVSQRKMMEYTIDGEVFLYPKPKVYTFIQYLPQTFAGAARVGFARNSWKGWTIMVGSTAVLMAYDQEILDAVQRASKHIGLDPERRYKSFIPFKMGDKDKSIYDIPDNVNSAVYSIGEGMPSIFLSMGMLTYGLIKDDYRSISTASQIFQATMAMGITTQILKRMAGRESPFVATEPGGAWHPFPNLITYQQNVPSHDAFPSGHMGTLMSTTVVIAANYPEKRWIKPVGYSVMTLVGLAMINNGVHWASDYPLAIGLGYVFGHATVKLNRFLKGSR